MQIGDVEGLISTAPPQQAPADPAKMADVQHKNNKLQVDAATAQGKAQTDLQIKQMEVQDAAADRANKLQLAQLSENTERLRLASTIAIHADSMDEAQKAANMKLISDHVGMAVKHGHELDKLDQTQGHDMRKTVLQHAQGLQANDMDHQQALEMQDNAPEPAGAQ